jgi:hypothetical protein
LAEQNQRTKHRVFNEPDEEFQGARTANHRLNEKPGKASFGTSRPNTLEHPRRFSTDLIGIAQIEHDAADIRLVSDIGRTDFEGYRKSNTHGDAGGLVRIIGGKAGRERNAISREHGGGLPCRASPPRRQERLRSRSVPPADPPRTRPLARVAFPLTARDCADGGPDA